MQNTYLTFCLLFLSFNSSYAGAMTYYSKTYTPIAEHLMKDDGHNAIFRVPLDSVFHYLPEDQAIKRKSIKLIANHLVPGKTLLALVRHYMCDHEIALSSTPHALFASLQEGKTHTYVVLDNALIFTESAEDPARENFKEFLTKHFFLAKLGRSVHFSGEFHVLHNHQTKEIFVVFDNSSGTYKPEGALLPQLKSLLEHSFNSNDNSDSGNLIFITKKFNEKVDKEKLFTHDKAPFINE